jgi:hypothetical protein
MEKETTTPQGKHRFNVRVEAWDKAGNNLGWRSHTIWGDFNDAMEEGREMYKKLFVKQIKQMSISNESGERLWLFLKGKAGMVDERGKFVN